MWPIENEWRGLSQWFSVKESTRQCRRYGFNPWPGKIPYAEERLSPVPQLLSLGPRACERQLLRDLEPMLCNKRSHCNEKPASLQLGTSPHWKQLEKSVWSNKDPTQPKINTIIIFKKEKKILKKKMNGNNGAEEVS